MATSSLHTALQAKTVMLELCTEWIRLFNLATIIQTVFINDMASINKSLLYVKVFNLDEIF